MSKLITLFGISNCDSIKKAKKWLNEHNIIFQFHDYKKFPPTEDLIYSFLTQHSMDLLINKRGTTWRNLPVNQKSLTNEKEQIGLIIQFPSLIKRPILAFNEKYIIGFNEKIYQNLFFD